MSALATTVDHHLREYVDNGFTIVRQALQPQAVAEFRGAIAHALDRLAAELHAAGTISDLHREASIETRLLRLLGGDDFGRSWDEPVFGPPLHALIQQPGIIHALRAILGEHIWYDGGHHLRPKLPQSQLTAFPWHQDSQYYGTGTEHLHVVSVWVPLVDVDERNGCLWFIPGSQRWGLLSGARGANQNMRSEIDAERLRRAQPAPMRVGDIVLFGNLTVHGSQVNHSAAVRWSVDLRYSATRSHDPATADVRRARQLYRAKLDAIDPGFAVCGNGAPVDFATWAARRAAARAAVSPS